MNLVDGPIHWEPDKAGQSVTCIVTLWQSHLDGLQALLQWLAGFEAGGHGTVPGHYELTGHYRELARRVREDPPRSGS